MKYMGSKCLITDTSLERSGNHTCKINKFAVEATEKKIVDMNLRENL